MSVIGLGLVLAWAAIGVGDVPSTGGEIHLGARAQKDGTLKVLAFNGRVNVRGWHRDSIDVLARFDEREARVELRVEGGAGRLQVVPVAAGSMPAGELDVVVPYSMFVAIRASGAAVVVRDVSGGSDVMTETGNVTVGGGGTRSAYVESTGGTIRIEAGTKILRAKSVEGDVHVARAMGFVEIQTVAGSVTMVGGDLSQGRVSTVSGNISYDGGFERTGLGFTFETHSGTIDLVFAPSVNADLDLRTVHGSVDNAFSGSRVGRGGAPVTALTFKGAIRVRRR